MKTEKNLEDITTNIEDKSANKNNKIGIPFILFIIFLILKLTDQIDWSWWWVTSPIWIVPVFLIGLSFFLILVIMSFILIGVPFPTIKEKLTIFTKKFENLIK